MDVTPVRRLAAARGRWERSCRPTCRENRHGAGPATPWLVPLPRCRRRQVGPTSALAVPQLRARTRKKMGPETIVRAWHERSAADVLGSLSGPKGLTTAIARARLDEYGANSLTEGQRRSPLNMFLAQFRDFMILVLLAAAAISGVVGDLKDTIVIGTHRPAQRGPWLRAGVPGRARNGGPSRRWRRRSRHGVAR